RRRSSAAPARATTPATSIAGPRPIDCDSAPTAGGPPMLPAAAATEPIASAVARARVGKSSADHAPSTGVSALANELHITLPIQNPAVPVPKLRLPGIALAPVSAVAGPLRPKRSVR